jgi:hypothetical protein
VNVEPGAQDGQELGTAGRAFFSPQVFSPYLLVVLKCPNKYFLYKKKLASRFMNVSWLCKKLHYKGRQGQMGWKPPAHILSGG